MPREYFELNQTNFEILNYFPVPLKVTQVDLVVTIRDTQKYPPEIQIRIDGNWERRSRTSYNGELLSLQRTEELADHLTIFAGATDYKTYLGTNLNQANYEALKEHPEMLSNALVSTAIIITSDNRIVLGRRAGCPQIGTIGGTVNTDEKFPMTHATHLFMHIEDEIKEELGISDSQMENADTRLLAVSKSTYDNRQTLTFIHRSPLTADQFKHAFRSKGAKDEHTELYIIDNSEKSVRDFVNRFNDYSATPAALDSFSIYLRQFAGIR